MERPALLPVGDSCAPRLRRPGPSWGCVLQGSLAEGGEERLHQIFVVLSMVMKVFAAGPASNWSPRGAASSKGSYSLPLGSSCPFVQDRLLAEASARRPAAWSNWKAEKKVTTIAVIGGTLSGGP